MSCIKCEDHQESGDGSYFFRWSNANIELRGCLQHITEVMDVLRKAQSKKKRGVQP